MKRGELWWAALETRQPVVLLSSGAGHEFCAVQIVAPATPAEKQGFLVMSGEQAIDTYERRRIVEKAGLEVQAFGIEVFLGTQEGLAEDGVVRVALPMNGKVFCTWILSLHRDYLLERIGGLSKAKQIELDVAIELSGVAYP